MAIIPNARLVAIMPNARRCLHRNRVQPYKPSHINRLIFLKRNRAQVTKDSLDARQSRPGTDLSAVEQAEENTSGQSWRGGALSAIEEAEECKSSSLMFPSRQPSVQSFRIDEDSGSFDISESTIQYEEHNFSSEIREFPPVPSECA